MSRRKAINASASGTTTTTCLAASDARNRIYAQNRVHASQHVCKHISMGGWGGGWRPRGAPPSRCTRKDDDAVKGRKKRHRKKMKNVK